MTRRACAILAISALLGSSPLRAAQRAAAPVAEVELRQARPGQVQALCALSKALGLRVRVPRSGQTVRLEISAGSRQALDEGLRRLRREAGAAGVRVRVRWQTSTAPVLALSCRSSGIHPLVRAADGVVLATPEYHGTFSSLMKLTLENMGFPSPMKGKIVSLLGVAEGRIGAVKSLEHLRSVCGHIGSVVVPRVVSVARVRQAFDEHGNCLDPAADKDIRKLGLDLVRFIHEMRCPEVSFEEWVRQQQEAEAP